MIERFTAAVLFTLYQTTIVLGIALLPVAILARRAGIALPIHRVLTSIESAYENSRGN